MNILVAKKIWLSTTGQTSTDRVTWEIKNDETFRNTQSCLSRSTVSE